MSTLDLPQQRQRGRRRRRRQVKKKSRITSALKWLVQNLLGANALCVLFNRCVFKCTHVYVFGIKGSLSIASVYIPDSVAVAAVRHQRPYWHSRQVARSLVWSVWPIDFR